jgi:hypothetical protein
MLCFKPDGTFTITQFTDLHYRNGEKKDLQTLRVMNQALDAEPTDLVVLTGDVIDGYFCRYPIRSYAEAVQPIVDRKLPWAAVFGNHDDEGSASRAELMASMRRLPGCLAIAGPAKVSGVGNYGLAITSGGKTAAMLYFIDSHAYDERARKEYDWIKQDQIDWYLHSSEALRRQNDGHGFPSLMFFHIPLPEFNDLWDSGIATGLRNEKICSPRHNSGMFSALRSAGDLMGVFVGHDHVNDFDGVLEGIHLCYGRATGFSSYGRDQFPRGARIIRLRAGQRTFETWLWLDPVTSD